jgi:hypothetical protein
LKSASNSFEWWFAYDDFWIHWLAQRAGTVLEKSHIFVEFLKRHNGLEDIHEYLGILKANPDFNRLSEMKWSPCRWSLFQIETSLGNGLGISALDASRLHCNEYSLFKASKMLWIIGFALVLLAQKHQRSAASDNVHQNFFNDEPQEKLIGRRALRNLSHGLTDYLHLLDLDWDCRKSLQGRLWYAIFADLCSFSILKSLLIDIQADEDSRTKASIAARIDGIYKALVSTFIWASKSDPLVESYKPERTEDATDREDSISEDEEVSRSRETFLQVVQRDKWEERRIKSSKDFLMGLGSGFYNDGTYNGFYVQQYGFKKHPKMKGKTPLEEELIAGSVVTL